MTTTAWIIASAAMLVLFAFIAAIAVDIWLVQTGRRTISRHTISDHRGWLFIVWAGIFAAVLFSGGALCGHLFFGQKVPCACCKCQECVCPR